jgi:PAS domain S-box-containing protein
MKIGLRTRTLLAFGLPLAVLAGVGVEAWRGSSATIAHLVEAAQSQRNLAMVNALLTRTHEPGRMARLVARQEAEGRELSARNVELERSARRARGAAAVTVALALLAGALLAAGIVREIGAREVARRELAGNSALLREAYDELSDLYENAPCGYHSVDADGVVVRMNRTELDWLGYARTDVVGRMHVMELVMPSSIEATRERLAQLETTDETRDVRVEYRRKDGTPLPALMSASAVRDREGRFIMTRTIVTDITQLWRAQQELEVVVADLHEALESVKTLTGLLPICSMCKKIRDDEGYWEGVESYVTAHTDVRFSHGVCPECFPKMFPGIPDGPEAGAT